MKAMGIWGRLLSRPSRTPLFRSNLMMNCRNRTEKRIYHCHGLISSPVHKIFVRTFVSPSSSKKLKNKLKDLVQQYGAVVIVFHTVVWGGFLGGFYFVLEQEYDWFDSRILLDYMEGYLPSSVTDRREQLLHAAHSSYGKFAIAYVLAMATGPPRLALTLFASPWLARRIASINSPIFQRYVLGHPLVKKIFRPPPPK